jgi:hypothetical protein
MKKHLDVAFEASSETTKFRLRLEGGFRRWIKGKNPQTRYVFTVLHEEDRPVDEDASHAAT